MYVLKVVFKIRMCVWCARTTAWVYLAHFWTGDAQRHVFSDSKVHKSKIKSWYNSKKNISVFSKLIVFFFITEKKKNPLSNNY